MKKIEKIMELETMLFVLDDSVENAKRNEKDLPEYFHWVLTAEVIRGQIQALQWTFDEDHFNKCPCCGSDKVYLTSAIHCKRCAVTTEI